MFVEHHSLNRAVAPQVEWQRAIHAMGRLQDGGLFSRSGQWSSLARPASRRRFGGVTKKNVSFGRYPFATMTMTSSFEAEQQHACRLHDVRSMKEAHPASPQRRWVSSVSTSTTLLSRVVPHVHRSTLRGVPFVTEALRCAQSFAH